MIVHASIDEKGKIKGGEAGDQTSKEVCTRSWYNKPWNVLLRCKDSNLAVSFATIGKKLADSNLVGYDQTQRNSLYIQLKKYNFNVDAYIKSGIKTETDCSAFIYACVCCVIASMRSDGNAPTTSTMKNFYKKYGFEVITDPKYLTSEANLLVGDILVKEGFHTVMSLTNGTKVNNSGQYYPKYTGSTTSIVTALREVGVKDTSLENRKRIGIANGVAGVGTVEGNNQMMRLLKQGKLKMI